MIKNKLQKILDDHKKWLNDKNDGVRADLRNANLRNANLIGANLSNANLSNAALCYANLIDANLSNAALCYANLIDANLSNAHLIGANLSNADLRGADLIGADLIGANLIGANLCDAVLDIKIFCLDRIGSSKRRTIYDATNDVVWCGCFKGTFAEWCDKINETYPDKKSQYRREYGAAIKYFKELAKIAKESEAAK